MESSVILAQPRGSRLRADAVYVDRSGSGRAPVGLRSGLVRNAGSLDMADVGVPGPPSKLAISRDPWCHKIP